MFWLSLPSATRLVKSTTPAVLAGMPPDAGAGEAKMPHQARRVVVPGRAFGPGRGIEAGRACRAGARPEKRTYRLGRPKTPPRQAAAQGVHHRGGLECGAEKPGVPGHPAQGVGVLVLHLAMYHRPARQGAAGGDIFFQRPGCAAAKGPENRAVHSQALVGRYERGVQAATAGFLQDKSQEHVAQIAVNRPASRFPFQRLVHEHGLQQGLSGRGGMLFQKVEVGPVGREPGFVAQKHLQGDAALFNGNRRPPDLPQAALKGKYPLDIRLCGQNRRGQRLGQRSQVEQGVRPGPARGHERNLLPLPEGAKGHGGGHPPGGSQVQKPSHPAPVSQDRPPPPECPGRRPWRPKPPPAGSGFPGRVQRAGRSRWVFPGAKAAR